LIEEPLQVFSARFLDNLSQAVCIRIAPGELHAVVFQAIEEEILAQNVVEHPQNHASFVVNMGVEQFDRGRVMSPHDGATVRGVFLEVSLGGLIQLVTILILAQMMTRIESFEVIRESLAQPNVRPISGSDQVPPPLMSQLMGDKAIAFEIDIGSLIVES